MCLHCHSTSMGTNLFQPPFKSILPNQEEQGQNEGTIELKPQVSKELLYVLYTPQTVHYKELKLT